MIIKNIEIYHFKSIYEKLYIDFSNVQGFWKIEGPVGSGKTSIGEAIIYGLFGDIKGKNNRDLISWGEKDGYVHITCITKGKELSIKRAIRGELLVQVDGNDLMFTNKNNAQFQLESEYYDVSKMTLELLCIISFNNFKSLSNMSPKETRAFLDNVFGFSILSEYTNTIKEKRKDSQEQAQDNIYKHNAILAQIKKIEDISNIAKIDDDKLLIIKELANLKTKTVELKSLFENRNNKSCEELRILQDELSKIKTLGINKANEIAFIEKGICPTCGAKIDQSQLQAKKDEKKVLQDAYKTTNDKLKVLKEEQNENVREYNSELQELTQKSNVLVSRKAKLEEQERRASIDLSKIEELKVQQKENEHTKLLIDKDLEEWDQLLEFCGTTMRQKVIGDFIPVLNIAIGEYTRKLNLPYTIEFNEEFECIVRLFSLDREISIRSLSTGQLKTVDMCIILGVLKVIFSGVNFNVMFLDELFSNMDSELRGQICNILKKELKENQTIFVVSHQEVSDASFDGGISASLVYEEGKEKSRYIVKKY